MIASMPIVADSERCVEETPDRDDSFYFETENYCCWLIDVCNPGGRAAYPQDVIEPFYLWFNFTEPDEVAVGDTVVEFDLALRGLKVRKGQPLPSRRALLNHFRAMLDYALDRCHEEELIEAAQQVEEEEAA